MGTNYYLYNKPPCECCKRPFDENRLHIGKSSYGWCFSLHVIPELNLNTLEAWKARWSHPGMTIMDEYGESISPDKMLSIITERYPGRYAHPDHTPSHCYVDGKHCIGNGDGTWDYITGEFI